MPSNFKSNSLSRLTGIVERITFHNTQNGWSVLKVSPFNEPNKLVTVVVHQAKVFAGSSMEFWGDWGHHPKHGEQFRAQQAIEKKPASSASLEKYLGSGLIKGVGPKTASRIVKFFKDKTLEVFEDRIGELLNVPGIADKKLRDIKNSWQEHKAIRDVMLFLQEYGISTLFAVKIYKAYRDKAIQVVSANPYQLAKDIYGIGFFSADKIALNMGFATDGEPRIEAGIKHVLSASREEGHCYLTDQQILKNTQELLQTNVPDKIQKLLANLVEKKEIKKRFLSSQSRSPSDTKHQITAYYANSLYYDEQYIATRVREWLNQSVPLDRERTTAWVKNYCQKFEINLSDEQQASIIGITGSSFSILTGGPGCGKTTTTKVLVKLLLAMKKKIILAAPTGRAAQRMSEVIGLEAKTIHRLLEWAPDKNGFKKSESEPLTGNFIVIDESSMLDINLAAALFKALPSSTQVLLIGDPDQLPSVGAGQLLHDLLKSKIVPSFRLTKVFRQAAESSIIRFAHEINRGQVPSISSPIHQPDLWSQKADCLFIDAEEATVDQIRFLQKAKGALKHIVTSGQAQIIQTGEQLTGIIKPGLINALKIEQLLVQEFENPTDAQAPLFVIPEKFKHVDILKLHRAQGDIEELQAILKSVHPWSALHYGMTGLDVVLKLYPETIPKHFGKTCEIQILSPQVRGTLGTLNLNSALQAKVNPPSDHVRQIKIGDRIYRTGDRVIQTRNNYDLGVFNGDIGRITNIDLSDYSCEVQFGKGAPVLYEKDDLTEIALAYAITIHKSQGSEFDAVIIPVATQHFKMLFRNLIYTGLTRAKKLCVFVGSRKALALAIRQIDNRHRQTALTELVDFGR